MSRDSNVSMTEFVGVADKSEALAPTYPQWGTQTYVVKRENFQLIIATYAFQMKNNVSTGEGEYADEIFS